MPARPAAAPPSRPLAPLQGRAGTAAAADQRLKQAARGGRAARRRHRQQGPVRTDRPVAGGGEAGGEGSCGGEGAGLFTAGGVKRRLFTPEAEGWGLCCRNGHGVCPTLHSECATSNALERTSPRPSLGCVSATSRPAVRRSHGGGVDPPAKCEEVRCEQAAGWAQLRSVKRCGVNKRGAGVKRCGVTKRGCEARGAEEEGPL